MLGPGKQRRDERAGRRLAANQSGIGANRRQGQLAAHLKKWGDIQDGSQLYANRQHKYISPSLSCRIGDYVTSVYLVM